MGFQDAETMSNQAWDFWLRIERGDVLAPDEWRSVLMAAEVVFSSDVVGSGLDWPITTGISDAESIAILRGLQRKLPRWRGSIQFNVTDAGIKLADPDRPQI